LKISSLLEKVIPEVVTPLIVAWVRPPGRLISVPLKTNVSLGIPSWSWMRENSAIGVAPPKLTLLGMIEVASNPEELRTVTRMLL